MHINIHTYMHIYSGYFVRSPFAQPILCLYVCMTPQNMFGAKTKHIAIPNIITMWSFLTCSVVPQETTQGRNTK